VLSSVAVAGVAATVHNENNIVKLQSIAKVTLPKFTRRYRTVKVHGLQIINSARRYYRPRSGVFDGSFTRSFGCVIKMGAFRCEQARRELQRGPRNHSRMALSQPHAVCAEIETMKASRGRKRGEGVHLPSNKESGERRKLPKQGPGQNPGQKWILCIYDVRKKPSRTPFPVFLSDNGPPKRRVTRENFAISPPPLLDGPGCESSLMWRPSFRCNITLLQLFNGS